VREVFDNRPATLTDYVAVLRRRKWIIIIIPLVSGLVAFEISNRQPALYRAQATVLVNRSEGAVTAVTNIQDPAAGDSTRFLTTLADIARSPKLAERAVEAAGVRGMTSGQLLGVSSVSPKADADVLDISVSYSDPRDAVLLANAYAQEFTRYKTELDTARINDALRVLQARTELLQKSGEATSLAYQTLAQYQGQLETIGKLVANSTSVLEPAGGAGQIEPRPRRNLILGGLSGIVFALGLAFFVDALDRRVRSSEEIEERLAIPLLGRVARPSRWLRRKHELVIVAQPASAAAETYRKLRGTIEFVMFQRGGTVRTIMFTSAIPREGKSTTIANLAVALARAGRRVALVDADLRRPFLHSFFGVDPEPGLADVAVGRTTLANGLRHVSLPLAGKSAQVAETNGRPLVALSPSNGRFDVGSTLHLLPCGTISPAVGEFLAGDGVSALLGELREQFDVVLVDAPPLTMVGDAKTLSAAVDAIVVVTAMGIERPLLRELAHELQNCRAPSLGFILMGIPRRDRYTSRSEYESYVQPAHQQSERSEQPL
jgi:polysaccharide biosynthesis transport protein